VIEQPVLGTLSIGSRDQVSPVIQGAHPAKAVVGESIRSGDGLPGGETPSTHR
jgi:hypothetical protein